MTAILRGCVIGLRTALVGGAVLVAALGQAGSAAGQCGVILKDEAPVSDGYGFHQPLLWDFDGDGPLPPELVAGADKGRVFAYNGTRWRQVGTRLSSPSLSFGEPDRVYKLLGFRGELYAVGASQLSDQGGALFRWTGAGWVVIPSTPTTCGTGTGASGWWVNATVWNDRIVVVGQNLRCGLSNVLALAWDGTRWSGLGNTYTNNPSAAVVSAAIGTADGRLLIGGTIPTNSGNVAIAELTGSVWTTRTTMLSSATAFAVNGFYELDGELLAATSALFLSGQGLTPIAVARENPVTRAWERWAPSGAGNGPLERGYQVFRDGDRTYVSGMLNAEAAGVQVRSVGGPWQSVTLDGSRPSRMVGMARVGSGLVGLGLNLPGAPCERTSCVFTGTPDDPLTLHAAAARFARLPGEVQALAGIAVTPAGTFVWPSGTVFPVALGHGANSCPTLSNIPARFDGYDWTNPEHLSNLRSILTAGDGETVALGTFTSVAGRPITTGIARWTGSGWGSYLAPLSTNVSSGVAHTGVVHAVETTASGSTVRRWNGAAWGTVGALFPGVTARLVSVGTSLFAYVPGTFAAYRLDGSVWTRLPDSPVRIDLATDAQGVLAVGASNAPAGAQPVARFAGAGWTLDPAFPTGVSLLAIRWHAGALYAGLSWSASSTGTAPVMRLEGGAWIPVVSTQPLAPGVNHPNVLVSDLFSEGDTLHIVGSFSVIGGQGAESWAKLYTGPPRVLTPPVASSVSRCGTAYFSVEPEVYHDPSQTYRWMRNGVALTDHLTGSGSVISGSATTRLRVQNVGPADAGSYALVLTNACGSTTTVAAALTVCSVDFNCDGHLDADDLSDFITCYFRARAQPGLCLASDFNFDGDLNADDLSDFLTAYFAGCG